MQIERKEGAVLGRIAWLDRDLDQNFNIHFSKTKSLICMSMLSSLQS